MCFGHCCRNLSQRWTRQNQSKHGPTVTFCRCRTRGLCGGELLVTSSSPLILTIDDYPNLSIWFEDSIEPLSGLPERASAVECLSALELLSGNGQRRGSLSFRANRKDDDVDSLPVGFTLRIDANKPLVNHTVGVLDTDATPRHRGGCEHIQACFAEIRPPLLGVSVA
jgi:hypothetical protein